MLAAPDDMATDPRPVPFSGFAELTSLDDPLRQAIAAATLRNEKTCLAPLLAAAGCPDETFVRARALALTDGMRRAGRSFGMAALMQEYGLQTAEGVALMRLAEALLRIPDVATRDALIQETLAAGDWRAHAGRGRPLAVSAVSLALDLARRAVTGADGGASRRLATAVVRAGAHLAVHMLARHFVAGPDIRTALRRSAARERRGYRHSYDMLGEAALTADDAARHFHRYADAIETVGRAGAGLGPVRGPGVSVKLSALHPRYCRAQAGRVMDELGPRLKELALRARRHDISLTIDAEEADRLELSLDLFGRLRLDPDLAGWAGLGFVVQAYGKRCPHVIDWLADLARRAGVSIMTRLVKGAYWDTEIRRAQIAGLSGFPVFTRKVYTDVSWLACARRLLDAGDALFPQFATHNARSVAAILALTRDRPAGSWELQCLHGMGEPLYDQLAGEAPCRIYAPVGTSDTLLSYLVRRLLENGANSSFVRQAARADAQALVADPVARIRTMTEPGAPHPAVRAPADLFGLLRRNSAGADLSDGQTLAALQPALRQSAARTWRCAPVTAAAGILPEPPRAVRNPGDLRDVVGERRDLAAADAAAVVAAARPWDWVDAAGRAGTLERAAAAMEAQASTLMGLLMREAGKTAASALGEVREAVDFLRYYAAAARAMGPGGRPAGVLLCVSPWNFPLSIFTGQIAAALAAGNAAIAKPAPETSLVAAEATRILHEAGAPRTALQLAPGDAGAGAALVAAPGVDGVLFTGSTATARAIARTLATRVRPDGSGPLLVAETAGLNCMIVDSSALPEQVVGDVLASAFDSAGQRCSALRVLCLQEEIAGPVLRMLHGAMRELAAGPTDRLATDIGPVISAAARDRLEAHVARLAAAGRRVTRLPLPPETASGVFVAPAIIEIDSLADVPEEAFGPILHVLRWRRAERDALIDAINGAGYGLTFGLHSRLERAADGVVARISAGNIYVNRGMIGAVVGSQPFGGRGLSGAGPKAGGPLMLPALMRELPADWRTNGGDAAAETFARWLEDQGMQALAGAARRMMALAPRRGRITLPGPAGERNLLDVRPAPAALLAPASATGLYSMAAALLACGVPKAQVIAGPFAGGRPPLPGVAAALLDWREAPDPAFPATTAFIEGDPERIIALRQQIAARDGPIVTIASATPEAVAANPALWPLTRLAEETCISINTAASGGDAALLAAAADD
ncbi:bifunctional proline dehydrogenase/L-glutamate gamma-semialdehyde dehydrogenase PutA [Camelimonas abortus]|uniref:Bifunctional protein PutA n=1 Tax=Camelimonas abortus TaxID=1017184 RepID=A0ABV7LGM1_9HYPH